MKPTIDQLINQLQQAKAKIGGDKVVSFWRVAHGPSYFLEPSPMQTPIDGKIIPDGTEVTFEIYQGPE